MPLRGQQSGLTRDASRTMCCLCLSTCGTKAQAPRKMLFRVRGVVHNLRDAFTSPFPSLMRGATFRTLLLCVRRASGSFPGHSSVRRTLELMRLTALNGGRSTPQHGLGRRSTFPRLPSRKTGRQSWLARGTVLLLQVAYISPWICPRGFVHWRLGVLS